MLNMQTISETMYWQIVLMLSVNQKATIQTSNIDAVIAYTLTECWITLGTFWLF